MCRVSSIAVLAVLPSEGVFYFCQCILGGARFVCLLSSAVGLAFLGHLLTCLLAQSSVTI